MMRSALAAVIILAFALASTVTLSAAPTLLSYVTKHMPGQDWVGHSKDQLMKKMGTPSLSFQNDNGSQTIRYVMTGPSTHDGLVRIVEEFNVNPRGRITSASVYRM